MAGLCDRSWSREIFRPEASQATVVGDDKCGCRAVYFKILFVFLNPVKRKSRAKYLIVLCRKACAWHLYRLTRFTAALNPSAKHQTLGRYLIRLPGEFQDCTDGKVAPVLTMSLVGVSGSNLIFVTNPGVFSNFLVLVHQSTNATVG